MTRGQRQIHRVGVHAFAESRDFIDEGNLCRDICRRRLAYQFGRGLIGHDHDEETGAVEHAHGVDAVRKEDQPLEPIEVAGLLDEGSVAIEKDGAPHDRGLSRWAVTERSTVSASIRFMHRWSIGHSRSMQGRHQTGCVITFASFRADSPPPLDGKTFGASAGPGLEAACVNPASLEGGDAALRAYLGSGELLADA